jgi:hypothetical protein
VVKRLIVAVAVTSACVAPSAPTSTPEPSAMPQVRTGAATDPMAVEAEFESMAQRPLWPGFEPVRLPRAIHDGRDTLLFGHPAPPAGFHALAGEAAVHRFAGRHPAVTANSSADIGGVRTATLLMQDGERRSAAALGAVLIHEAFHIFPAARHPTWGANEVELFSYPVEDETVLRHLDLEERALRLALEAAGAEAARCWTGVALKERRDRFARLTAGAIAYERGNELKEGLARYVQDRAAGLEAEVEELAPEKIRDRAYAVGGAMAALLDRFDAEWKSTLEAERVGSLDELLAATTARPPVGGAPRCGFSAAQVAAAAGRARSSAAAVQRERASARSAFEGAAGWRLTITAGSRELLWPQSFDPMNVRRVGPAEILHGRFLKLGNGAGTAEILGHASLTRGAGKHPLFDGVRMLTVTGLSTEPVLVEREGVVTLEQDGIALKLRGARVERRAGRREVLVWLD